MTVVKEEDALKLHRLMETQMLVRIVVHDSTLRARNDCRIEVVTSCLDLYQDGLQKASGFLHLDWYCHYAERGRELAVSQFEMHDTCVFCGVVGNDAHSQMLPNLREVLEYWNENATQDGTRPYVEWLEPKPFVGIASLGYRPNARIQPLPQDHRVFLTYYGSLLMRLQAYLDQLSMIRRSFDDSCDLQCMMLAETIHRFSSFVNQVQADQFKRVFE